MYGKFKQIDYKLTNLPNRYAEIKASVQLETLSSRVTLNSLAVSVLFPLCVCVQCAP